MKFMQTIILALATLSLVSFAAATTDKPAEPTEEQKKAADKVAVDAVLTQLKGGALTEALVKEHITTSARKDEALKQAKPLFYQYVAVAKAVAEAKKEAKLAKDAVAKVADDAAKKDNVADADLALPTVTKEQFAENCAADIDHAVWKALKDDPAKVLKAKKDQYEMIANVEVAGDGMSSILKIVIIASIVVVVVVIIAAAVFFLMKRK